MTRLKLMDRLQQGHFFLDGAMGTQLMAGGAEPGSCYDYLNVSSPDIVAKVHHAYFDAGVHAVITNTLGGNKYALTRHGKADEVEAINLAAATLARKVAGDSRYVLGDVSTCGDFLEPIGTVKPDELKAAFVEQVEALAQGGVDGIIIETMTAIDEVILAVEAAESACDLPILVSLSYDPAPNDFRTMMGVDPAQTVAKLADHNVAAIGYNCGTLDMDSYVELAKAFADAIGDKPILLIAEPNAGKPDLIDGKTVYNLSPDDFADALVEIQSAGASILGGCCGTSPAHIKAMVEKISKS